MAENKVLTFKEWRKLHENFGGSIPLGVSTPQSFSVISGNVDSVAFENMSAEELEAIEEAVKKAKKKMLDVPPKKIVKDKEIDIDDKEIDIDDIDDEDIDDEDIDDEDIDDEDEDEVGDELDKGIMLSKKKSKKKSTKKSKKNMKEEDEWWNSVRKQMTGDSSVHWDGTGDEPKPGEPGFAPQGRVGWFS